MTIDRNEIEIDTRCLPLSRGTLSGAFNVHGDTTINRMMTFENDIWHKSITDASFNLFFQ
jgi:hypothetical protein